MRLVTLSKGAFFDIEQVFGIAPLSALNAEQSRSAFDISGNHPKSAIFMRNGAIFLSSYNVRTLQDKLEGKVRPSQRTRRTYDMN